jgi:hypothetical protein
MHFRAIKSNCHILIMFFGTSGNSLTTYMPTFARLTASMLPGICKYWRFFLTDFWAWLF